jgi:hypothetical protein
MKKQRLLGAIAGWLLICGLSATAQEKGIWHAASSTAQSITGDILLSEEKLTINFSSFVIAKIRELKPGEVSSVFDADASAGRTGSLYRLSIPADRKFLHKNTLCGSDSTQWMAIYVEGRSLHLAFFSGARPPEFTPEAMANSSELCGTFSYER